MSQQHTQLSGPGSLPPSLPGPAQLGASTPAQAHHPQDLCSRQGRSVMEALGPRRLVTSRTQPESERLLHEHRPGLAPSHSLCWGAPALPAWPKLLPGRAGLWSWVCKGLPALPPGMRARPLSSRPLGGSPPRGRVMRSPHAALSPGSPALALSACCSHTTHPGPCQPAVCAQSGDVAKPFQHQ